MCTAPIQLPFAQLEVNHSVLTKQRRLSLNDDCTTRVRAVSLGICQVDGLEDGRMLLGLRTCGKHTAADGASASAILMSSRLGLVNHDSSTA